MAQTDVRQDGADYNRCSGKWKALFLLIFCHSTDRATQVFCEDVDPMYEADHPVDFLSRRDV